MVKGEKQREREEGCVCGGVGGGVRVVTREVGQ